MSDAHVGPGVRYTHCASRPYHRRSQWHYQGQFHADIDMWKEQIHPGRKMLGKGQNEIPQSWFKITIPYGRQYDKTWLLDSIQSHCNVPFTPVDFHYVKMQAQFFVQDASTASALRNVSSMIRDEENRKIRIFVNHSTVPHSVQNKLTPEQMEQLKLTMNKRYDYFHQALDLQSFRFDPDLVGHNIDMILNRRNCMGATLKIIEENFSELLSLNLRSNKLYQLDGLSDIVQKAPKIKILNLSNNELKSAWELEKIKGLKLEELWLEGNPLCDNFSKQSTYVRSILDSFPKLLRLDGHELPPPIIFGIVAYRKLPVCKGSVFGSETLKNSVMQFLEQYYRIYDYGDRQSLLGAYHDEACFSLTILFNPKDLIPSWLHEYFRDSRNIKKLKDPVLWIQLLKHTKYDVVNSLRVLPRTQHDISSFVVDICVHTEKMLCFSVSGVFKEVEGPFQAHVRAFTRIFIGTPSSNSSLCIVNDQLCVGDLGLMGTRGAFSTPVSTPFSSSMPTFYQEQQQMVPAFSTQSGMYLGWPQRYLYSNNWDYTRASKIFVLSTPRF
ncbi:nuclear RNA export factor 2-like [Elephas maximus indicus]|uniref:nuclear RNA export factor 2-like n=1 Tax=Elephas maximus indicus TaxID=99487 RepID=UPI002115E4CA|nr:nuclear RNA export factor 2-like [Elephas maximus indicus]